MKNDMGFPSQVELRALVVSPKVQYLILLMYE